MTLDSHRNSYCIARRAGESRAKDKESTTDNNDCNNNIDIK